uniref:ParB-like N-terminal domain-containing protein n=1 Tax=viral metagenome TaxID=1070528 RepID=A0A6M3ILD5_9ZZZZ
MKKIAIDKIYTADPFQGLFPVKQDVFDAIRDDMRDFGYDDSQPIIVWKSKGLVIDGHTRLKAAKELGLTEVYISEKEFQDEDEALAYAIHNQRDRRNLTDADLLRCVRIVDERKKKGEHLIGSERDEAGHYIPNNIRNNIIGSSQPPTHVTTAQIVGISPSKVQQVRKVEELATPEEKRDIDVGRKSIHRVYQDIKQQEKQPEVRQERKPSETPTFNATNDKIKWAKWTWNPVTGCKHGCKYCYARDIANRFYPEKFEPTFRPERLGAPFNTKIPRDRINEEGINKVFLVSMGDLFGEWVPQEWIDKIFDSVKRSPQWIYIALTKNPQRYLTIKEYPENLWIGASADVQRRADNALLVFRGLRERGIRNVLFLSCEPLMEAIDLKYDVYDWVIIGGRSRSSEMVEGQPDTNWLLRLSYQVKCTHGKKIFWKENVDRPQEYPA